MKKLIIALSILITISAQGKLSTNTVNRIEGITNKCNILVNNSYFVEKLNKQEIPYHHLV